MIEYLDKFNFLLVYIILGLGLFSSSVFGAAPVITVAPTSISLIESATPSTADGDSLCTLTVTDADGDGFNCVLSNTNPNTTAFTLLLSSGSFKAFLATNPPFEYDNQRMYVLTFTCTDDTLNSSTATFTVNLLSNTPPTMSVFPGFASINDGETTPKKIYNVTVTDTESDPFSCDLVTTGTPFNIRDNAGYEIWFENLIALNAATNPSYSLTIRCSDDWGSSQGVLTVTVNANAPPAFTGLPASVDIKESDTGGSSIYTVTVSDPESDPYSCGLGTITPAPTGSVFSLPKTGSQYDVNLNVGHSLESDTTSKFVITIECTDRASSTSTGTLTVNIGSNTPPSIGGLTTPLTVVQGEAGNRVLQALTVTDAESNTYTCTMTSSPVTSDFNLNYATSVYSIRVIASPVLASSSYTLNVTCSDDYGSTSETVTVQVSPTNVPVITSLPAATSIVDIQLNQTLIHTLLVTDADGETVTCSIASSPAGGPFLLVQDVSVPEYKIYRTAVVATAALYTVTVTCSDTAGGTVSANLTVSVTVNNAPSITALPDTTIISENVITETNLWNFTVTDVEGDTFVCTLTSDPSGPFDLRKDAASGVYTCFLTSSPNLDAESVPQYNLTFECTDTPGGKSSSGVLTVTVIKNRFPQFTNLPASDTEDAMSVVKGNSIFAVTATDEDKDTITYSMSISPSTSSFTINSVTGEITAARDLKYELVSDYIITVSASDSKKISNSTITLKLTNVNTAPIISNLDLAKETVIYKKENIATGSALQALTTFDPDTSPTLTVTYTVYPSAFTLKFRYISSKTFALAAGETFDYEYLSSYLVTFYINDTMAQTGPYYLRINIIDVAEPCVFKYTTYKAETYEANVGGGAVNPGYGVTDPDNPETITYSFLPVGNRNLFDIHPQTGEITFKVNYDVDATHPANVTLMVKCEDSRGETGTATVLLYIKDINDNIPEFPTGLVYFISQYTTPGAWIGTLSATDIDSGENADVEYYGSSSTGSAYFRINTNGRVYLTTNRHLTWPFGTTHTFTITGIDQGSPRLKSTTTLDIVYINVTTTTASPTTQSPDSNWWSDPAHIALVVFACILALLLLALLLYLLLKYCRKPGFCNRLRDLCRCNKCCKRKPPQPKVSKKPTPKSEPFKFWDGNDNNTKREVFSTQFTEGNIPKPMVV